MKNPRIITAALCIVALALGGTSCRKDKNGNTPGEPMTIGASIEQTDSDAKTFLAPHGSKVDIFWSAGDKIKLFGAGDTHGEEFTLKEDGGAGTASGTFEGTAPAPYSPYYAAYPETATFDGGSTFTFTIPATITGVAAPSASTSGNYSFIQKSCVPMVGVSVHEDELRFYSAMSSVFIALKGSGTDKVKTIVLTDLNNHPLNGTLTVKQDDNNHGIDFDNTSLTGGTNTLTLNLSTAVTLDEEYSMFCFPVPKGAFAGNADAVKIEVKDETGSVITTIKKSLSGGVAANAAYAVVETINNTPTITASTTPLNIDSKTSIAPGTSQVDVNWSSGDVIKVFGQAQSGGVNFNIQDATISGGTATFQGEAFPQGEVPYYAVYPTDKFTGFNFSSKTFSFTVPSSVTIDPSKLNVSKDGIFNFVQVPMVGYKADANSDMQFQNAMSIVYVTLKGSAKITKIILADQNNNKLDGTLTVTLDNNGNIASTAMTGGTSSSLTINLGEGVQLNSGQYSVFCFPFPKDAVVGGAKNLRVRIYDKTGMALRSDFSLASASSAGDAKAYKMVGDNVQPTPMTLPYTFKGDGVNFYITRANLWYDGSAFHFEPNQWTASTSSWTANHVGHFYWASKISDAVRKDYNGSGEETWNFTNSGKNKPNSALTVEGVNNKYFLPNPDALDYIAGRTSTVGVSGKELNGMATVNGVKGVILLPDNWDARKTFSYGAKKCNLNVYSNEQWDDMEYDGALFLPITGAGSYNSWDDPVGEITERDMGYYWGGKNKVALIFDESDGLDCDYSGANENSWLSIRLFSLSR